MPDAVSYVRISIHLPSGSEAEQLAAERVAIELHHSYGGSTMSGTQPAVFQGYWVNPNGKLYIDDIAIAFTDVKVDDENEVVRLMQLVEDYARETYDSLGAHQEAFWITSSPVQVYSVY